MSSSVITREVQIPGIGPEDATWTAAEDAALEDVLEPLEAVRVHQHLDVVEVCLGWERNNRYSVYNTTGEQILYVYEATQCYARQCYGSLREFTLIVTDNDDNRLLYLQRPLRCSSRCFYSCCCLQEMSIHTPPDSLLALVKERWSCCIPEYELVTPEGSALFQMEGSCFHCRCCCSISFVVRNDSGVEVATIRKEWGGCKELIGACNDFTIKYLNGLSSNDKVSIFAAAFLLDFNYFERHGKCF
ncbi:unnamed protein product [Candidula unifasciata]|uniref:Phospholipid scramblase n=1 Tax=Candidula unifasciata TaxID=100452 RepID=A0A8S3YY48_9EUPU|nr:unnamed protein product [Candidula unifasciata]